MFEPKRFGSKFKNSPETFRVGFKKIYKQMEVDCLILSSVSKMHLSGGC